MESGIPLFRFTGRSLFTLCALFFVLLLIWLSTGYPPRARYVPQVVAAFTLLCLLLQLVLDSCPRIAARYHGMEKTDIFKSDGVKEEPPAGGGPEPRLELIAFFWLAVLLVSLVLFGFIPSIPFYILFYVRFQAELTWPKSSAYAAGTLLFIYVLFVRLFEIRLYRGILVETFLDF